MKTSEDVLGSGLYASRCCGRERIFDKHEVFQRCPHCNGLCEWEMAEMAEIVVAPKKTKREAA